MKTDTTSRHIRLVLVSLADGTTDGVPVGCYLAAYDPEGNDGHGLASWTPDADKALTFATGAEATACYREVPHSRPLRADGCPNQPLTMFTVMRVAGSGAPSSLPPLRSATVRPQADRRDRDFAGSTLDRRELSNWRWRDL
jgi:hypothetical protein